MPMDKSGKYHMNPHHAKMADARGPAPKKEGAEGSPKEEASEPMSEAMAEGDQGGQMMTCPSCGAQFPEELGLAPEQAMPGHGAAPTHESGALPALSGY